MASANKSSLTVPFKLACGHVLVMMGPSSIQGTVAGAAVAGRLDRSLLAAVLLEAMSSTLIGLLNEVNLFSLNDCSVLSNVLVGLLYLRLSVWNLLYNQVRVQSYPPRQAANLPMVSALRLYSTSLANGLHQKISQITTDMIEGLRQWPALRDRRYQKALVQHGLIFACSSRAPMAGTPRTGPDKGCLCP